MIKNILLIVFGLTGFQSFAQPVVDTTIKLDVLQAPVSPAFNILGISLTDVERPTDVTSFALSIQQATNNFTSLPNSYAVEVAPFLMSKRKYTLSEFDNGNNAFKQSFLISAGFTHMGPKGKENIDSLKTTKLGLGIKFSIVRPRWSESTQKKYSSLIQEQKKQLDWARKFDETHSKKKRQEQIFKRRKQLESKDDLTKEEEEEFKKLKAEFDQLETDITDALEKELPNNENYKNAKAAALGFKQERKGFFLDFAGGFALNFPDNRFSNSSVYRAGAWFTGGHENGNSGFSFLGIIRYLYNPETIFADPQGLIKGGNVSTFDMGARAILDGKDKFLFSTEAIYRSVIGNDKVKPSWRLVLNAEYDLGINRKLTFAFGRDFDGTINKGGNLLAAINLIAGFGGERKLQ